MSSPEEIHAQLMDTVDKVPNIKAPLEEAMTSIEEVQAIFTKLLRTSNATEASTIQDALANAHQGANAVLGQTLLSASLIQQADRVIMGVPPEPDPNPYKTFAAAMTVPGDPSKAIEPRTRPRLADSTRDDEGWHDTPLLSDPSQITYPDTYVAEHPSGRLDLNAFESATGYQGTRVSGQLDEGKLTVGWVESVDAPPGLTSYAVKTYVREGVRRGAKELEAYVVEPAIMRSVIRSAGVENIQINDEQRNRTVENPYRGHVPKSDNPQQAKQLMDLAESGGAKIKLDLTTKKARQWLNKLR